MAEKKKFVKPQIEVIELNLKAGLLNGSPDNPGCKFICGQKSGESCNDDVCPTLGQGCAINCQPNN